MLLNDHISFVPIPIWSVVSSNEKLSIPFDGVVFNQYRYPLFLSMYQSDLTTLFTVVKHLTYMDRQRYYQKFYSSFVDKQ